MVGAVTHVKSNAVADFTGTVTVFNSQGSTVTANATDMVRPSDWNSAHAQVATLSGNTAGVSTLSGTNFVLQGGNGLSLSGAQGANAATIVVSAGNYLTTAMASDAATISNIRVSAGTTSNLLSALTFANSNGVTFGLNASTLTASHNGLTTARASNDGVGLNTAQTNVTWTVNSAGISLNASGYAGTATGATNASVTANSGGISVSVTQSNQAVSAANGSYAFQTLSFSNVNGISFGTSAGSAITASHNALTTARASNDAIGLNTAVSNVTATINSAGLSLDARGYAGTGTTFNGANVSGSMTVNSGGVQLSLSAGAGGGVTPVASASNGSFSFTTIAFANANNVTFGTSAGSIITASVAAPSGGAAQTLSQLVLVPHGGYGGPVPFAQSSISLGQNSLYMLPVYVDHYVTLDHIRMPVLVTNSSSAVSSGQKGQTFRFGVYTRENSTRLSQIYSTSYTIAASISSNVSFALSLITAIGDSTSYNSVSASSAGLNLSASLHGPRELIMPFSTLLTPGEYFFAVHASTSGAGTVGNVLNISNLAVAYQTFNRPGQSTNASNSGFYQGAMMGTYSAATAALPGTINNTEIRQLGTVPTLFGITGTV